MQGVHFAGEFIEIARELLEVTGGLLMGLLLGMVDRQTEEVQQPPTER